MVRGPGSPGAAVIGKKNRPVSLLAHQLASARKSLRVRKVFPMLRVVFSSLARHARTRTRSVRDGIPTEGTVALGRD
jgi:hypothetical protein